MCFSIFKTDLKLFSGHLHNSQDNLNVFLHLKSLLVLFTLAIIFKFLIGKAPLPLNLRRHSLVFTPISVLQLSLLSVLSNFYYLHFKSIRGLFHSYCFKASRSLFGHFVRWLLLKQKFPWLVNSLKVRFKTTQFLSLLSSVYSWIGDICLSEWVLFQK